MGATVNQTVDDTIGHAAKQGNSGVLRVRDLTFSVTLADGSRLKLLNGVNLEVAAGSSTAIMGESGSGKTTLLSLLAGFDVPTAGEVELFGTAISGLDEDARARLRAGRVGFVFQSFHLLRGLTALENVALPLELAGQTAGASALAREALTRVGLAQRQGHFPAQLSGGEQQRVAVARAFVTQPRLLFADEPTGNLDARTGQQIVELLFSLRDAAQTTLVVVTHDHELAARCDSAWRLRGGVLEPLV